jgi:protein O-GlcNAc transferase
LQAAGHSEWIAQSEDDYLRIAMTLAGDRLRLAAVRTTMRSELRRGPLLDHAGQAALFAAALQSCWKAWCERPAKCA